MKELKEIFESITDPSEGAAALYTHDSDSSPEPLPGQLFISACYDLCTFYWCYYYIIFSYY